MALPLTELIHQGLLYRNGDDEVGDGEMIVGRQVLLRLRGYISVCPTLQLSHNDVPGVGLGGCWNQVVPSHSLFHRLLIFLRRRSSITYVTLFFPLSILLFLSLVQIFP